MSTDSDGVTLLDYPAAAAMLGLGVRTLKRAVADGSLRHVRVGRTVRFRLTDLESFLEAHARGGEPTPKTGK